MKEALGSKEGAGQRLFVSISFFAPSGLMRTGVMANKWSGRVISGQGEKQSLLPSFEDSALS